MQHLYVSSPISHLNFILTEFQNQVALMIYPQVPPGISSSVNVVYLPQLGYLAVIQADADEPPEILGWESRVGVSAGGFVRYAIKGSYRHSFTQKIGITTRQ